MSNRPDYSKLHISPLHPAYGAENYTSYEQVMQSAVRTLGTSLSNGSGWLVEIAVEYTVSVLPSGRLRCSGEERSCPMGLCVHRVKFLSEPDSVTRIAAALLKGVAVGERKSMLLRLPLGDGIIQAPVAFHAVRRQEDGVEGWASASGEHGLQLGTSPVVLLELYPPRDTMQTLLDVIERFYTESPQADEIKGLTRPEDYPCVLRARHGTPGWGRRSIEMGYSGEAAISPAKREALERLKHAFARLNTHPPGGGACIACLDTLGLTGWAPESA